MDDAAGELNQANSTMQNIDSTGLDQYSVLPFWGTVEILKEMTNLLSWFALAAANGTQCYTAIEGVLNTLQNLDFSGSEVLGTNWDDFAADVASADAILDAAEANMLGATKASQIATARSYGEIIDTSIKPVLIDFSSMLDSFSSNISEISSLMGGLTGTVSSIQSFTQGFALFNNSYETAMDAAGGDGPLFFSLIIEDPDFNRSEDLMNYSKNNASDAWTDIDSAILISSSVKDNWQNILYYPAPPADPDPNATFISIAGLAQGVLDTIFVFKQAGGLAYDPGFHGLIQAYFEYMELIDLNSIFGGG